ncbi:hypothetical protein M3Y98_01081000 [Aphelenchoides besseyi]|nr:hypothetical protein M3Y98_01081000 [Aphelenchoides besseyi]
MAPTDETVRFSPSEVISDLFWLGEECERRCLDECAVWASEQMYYMIEKPIHDIPQEVTIRNLSDTSTLSNPRQNVVVDFARRLIRGNEYYRAKFVLAKLKRQNSIEHFLFYFSWYMMCLRRKAEFGAEDDEQKEENADETFLELSKDIERLYRKSPDIFDSFLLYLLGQIRRDAQLYREAKQTLIEAIKNNYRCLPAWDCLVPLVKESDINEIQTVAVKSWQLNLFTAKSAARLQILDVAKDYFNDLKSSVFGDTPYILCSIGAVKNNLQENRSAIECFQQVRRMDPYRIDQMNLYSDSLFIMGDELELSQLADSFNNTHKFFWETCCILANYYSIRRLHDKAIDYLKRAIRLRPDDAQVFILLGHEYLHTKNQQGASRAYRRAISIDSKSYRAWYALGQLYEILKLPAHALYYYQQAVRCKPTDSRMLIATGVVLAKLQRYDDAEKCYKKAFQIGDVEGNALTHLGSLYQEMDKHDQAAKAYEQHLKLYCNEEKDYGDEEMIATCCQFLAEYYQNKGQLERANDYAQRCLHYDKTKEFAGHLLRLIKVERATGRKRATSETRPTTTTPSTSVPFSSFIRQSTPTGIPRSPRAQVNEMESEIAHNSPENAEEEMSIDEDDGGADYSF